MLSSWSHFMIQTNSSLVYTDEALWEWVQQHQFYTHCQHAEHLSASNVITYLILQSKIISSPCRIFLLCYWVALCPLWLAMAPSFNRWFSCFPFLLASFAVDTTCQYSLTLCRFQTSALPCQVSLNVFLFPGSGLLFAFFPRDTSLKHLLYKPFQVWKIRLPEKGLRSSCGFAYTREDKTDSFAVTGNILRDQTPGSEVLLIQPAPYKAPPTPKLQTTSSQSLLPQPPSIILNMNSGKIHNCYRRHWNDASLI